MRRLNDVNEGLMGDEVSGQQAPFSSYVRLRPCVSDASVRVQDAISPSRADHREVVRSIAIEKEALSDHADGFDLPCVPDDRRGRRR
jgi:hypothetical protein